jgi:transcriptional antiterminator RfaH
METSVPELPAVGEAGGLRWWVAHTRARCEKQVLNWADREGIPAELPCYTTIHRYRGKTVTFRKPLFPGYVFLHAPERQTDRIRQCRYVAQVLVPPDASEFAKQLGDILLAISTGLELRPAPDVVVGVRVSIVEGPLQGLEGIVVQRDGPLEVILRLDFIGQAAAIRLPAQSVERLNA